MDLYRSLRYNDELMAVVENGQVKLSYDEYIHLPDDGRIHEIIDGYHYMSPAPFLQHQRISRRIQFQLYEQLEKTGLAEVFNAPTDVHLSETSVVQPDILVVDSRRKRILSPEKINAAPDLVVEVLSKSTAQRDLSLKLKIYEQSGVPEYWIVDPEAHTVTVFKMTSEGTYGSSRSVFERIEFHTERLHAAVDLTAVW